MKARWTYQVPPAGSDASGLEDYIVETSDGEAVGKVIAVLERESERYVAFDRGAPPLAHDRRAVRWRAVETIDHDTLSVRLRVAAVDLERALALDPANQVENGEADAVRVTQLPAALTRPAEPGVRGPIDRSSYAAAISLFAAGLIVLLALFLAAAGTEFTWEFALFAVPAVLIAAAGVLGYRTFRQPYRRSR